MNNVFASKTNRAFFQTVFASLFALVSVFFLSLKIYEASLSYFGIIMHKIKDYCNCTSMTQFLSMHPVIFGTIIIFGIMILGLIIYSLRKLAKLVLQTKGYADYYLLFAEANHSPKLKLVMEDLGIDENKVIEINKPEIVVFCFGILDPRICISQFLVNSLDKDELKAVLAHENQHMASYEPLK